MGGTRTKKKTKSKQRKPSAIKEWTEIQKTHTDSQPTLRIPLSNGTNWINDEGNLHIVVQMPDRSDDGMGHCVEIPFPQNVPQGLVGHLCESDFDSQFNFNRTTGTLDITDKMKIMLYAMTQNGANMVFVDDSNGNLNLGMGWDDDNEFMVGMFGKRDVIDVDW